MYQKQSKGVLLIERSEKTIVPMMYESKLWKIWRTVITISTCFYCASMNGRIISASDLFQYRLPVHLNCRCCIEALNAVVVGTVTNDGVNGVDYYVAVYGSLPENYITKEIAEAAGWKRKRGNLSEVLPGRVIGGNLYKNRDKRLPEVPGRIWYEADFNYDGGFRNDCRLMYSNDGLLFVTYDHYMTFYEVGLENLI